MPIVIHAFSIINLVYCLAAVRYLKFNGHVIIVWENSEAEIPPQLTSHFSSIGTISVYRVKSRLDRFLMALRLFVKSPYYLVKVTNFSFLGELLSRYCWGGAVFVDDGTTFINLGATDLDYKRTIFGCLGQLYWPTVGGRSFVNFTGTGKAFLRFSSLFKENVRFTEGTQIFELDVLQDTQCAALNKCYGDELAEDIALINSSDILILGQSFVESGFCDQEDYLRMIEAVKNYYGHASIVYKPHPNECSGAQVASKLNLRLVEAKHLPVEVLASSCMISNVATFGSSGAFAFHKSQTHVDVFLPSSVFSESDKAWTVSVFGQVPGFRVVDDVL